ncbi:hypothetical protein GOP47_0008784 [Adiantum capillus-veneris]|uniref:Autophagy-related protein n=1 Tax=Adiantum capillus-veneris TaxID=13818 RepID=A0A9D4ZIH7_ADICA|nr:hypothetical protein GOP47_0008784 [Adiantum capillus-veneris]
MLGLGPPPPSQEGRRGKHARLKSARKGWGDPTFLLKHNKKAIESELLPHLRNFKLFDPSTRLRSSPSEMAKSSFKQEHDLEKRKAEAQRIREKYTDRVPVIVEKAERSDIPNIDKKKYLVPADLTVGQFVYVIRKRIKLNAEKAIFIFVNDVLPPTVAMMSTIYDAHKDEDGFLYVTYSGENTFGSKLELSPRCH